MNKFSVYRFLKKLFTFIVVFLVILLVLFFFREPLLRSVGNYLVYEDPLTEVEALFLLSGNPYERSNYASELFHTGITEKIVCTGEIIPYNIRALNLDEHEGDLSKNQLMKNGVPEERIILIEQGRNTWEEANVIKAYCLEYGIRKIGVLSSSFHTRRIKQTFRRVFRNTDIEYHIYPAPVEFYSQDNWWKDERGVIIVNNEYMKLLYYRLKY